MTTTLIKHSTPKNNPKHKMRRTSLAWCIIVLFLTYSQVNATSSNQRSTTTTTTQRILKTQAELDTLFFDIDDEESSQDHDHDTSSPTEQDEITEESAETEGSSSTRCVALTECTLCGVGAGDEEACDTTGRHQLFECAVRGKEKRHDIYKSCSRTASDEQFLLIRMQLLCVTLGCIALMNVRKQKMKNSSLFDQRRRRNNAVVPNTHATAGSESKIKYTPLKSEEVVIGGRDVHEGGDGDLV
uniref:Uncharacterized protein n=1 Tax=Ditylum brightwellii TaxID=49249 RepID=A0A7S1ZI32_9STRA